METMRTLDNQNRFVEILTILSKDVDDSETLSLLAEFIIDRGISIDDALSVINDNYNHPSIDRLLNNLGTIFWEMQGYDYVIPLLQQSLTLNPKDPDTLYNMSYVLHTVGEHEMALTYLRSIELKSNEALSLIEEVSKFSVPESFKEYRVERIDIPYIAYPVYVRMDTTDPYAFKQIFEFQEYRLTNLPFTPKFIIDGGANAGYASLWFANLYPEAQIVAIEAEKSNYEITRYNTRPYSQIEAVHAGLWNKDTNLTIKDVGLGKWGTMVVETNELTPESITAVTIQSLLENSGFDEIDILKLDIEGAEREVFSQGYEAWLGKVKVLIIELHDSMKRGCSKAFFAAVSQYDFAFSMQGENIVLVRGDYYYN